MEYQMTCEDGFTVRSKSKDEVAGMGVWHVMMMHPNEKISMNDALKMVKPAAK
ncbi:MAG: hypothetical protein V1837_00715 [Candidatus Woesearchaeota archaeon]